MCNTSGIIFGVINLTQAEVAGKKIIEVGSFDINGSLQSIIKSWHPQEYVGVDIKMGPGVDLVCNAEDLINKFNKNSYDIVISTELIEHVKNWKKVVSNIKNICKPSGIILITTRSYGFAYHSYPDDFWRYEIQDLKNIFSDCKIEKLEKDKLDPGVFIKVKKPTNFIEKDLTNYKLYSIIKDKKNQEIDVESIKDFQKKYLKNQYLKNKFFKLEKFIFNMGKFIFKK